MLFRVVYVVTGVATRYSDVGEERLGTILQEEKGWADDANARRAWARAIAVAALVAPAALTVVGVVLYVVTLQDCRKRHTAKFQDKYFRDVPSDDHPAVLGCLYHGDKVEQGELAATLMRLTDLGVVKVEQVKTAGKGPRGGRNAADYRIARAGVEPSEPIDAKTVELFFDKLGPLASDEGRAATCDSILLSDLNRGPASHGGLRQSRCRVEEACEPEGALEEVLHRSQAFQPGKARELPCGERGRLVAELWCARGRL